MLTITYKNMLERILHPPLEVPDDIFSVWDPFRNGWVLKGETTHTGKSIATGKFKCSVSNLRRRDFGGKVTIRWKARPSANIYHHEFTADLQPVNFPCLQALIYSPQNTYYQMNNIIAEMERRRYPELSGCQKSEHHVCHTIFVARAGNLIPRVCWVVVWMSSNIYIHT